MSPSKLLVLAAQMFGTKAESGLDEKKPSCTLGGGMGLGQRSHPLGTITPLGIRADASFFFCPGGSCQCYLRDYCVPRASELEHKRTVMVRTSVSAAGQSKWVSEKSSTGKWLRIRPWHRPGCRPSLCLTWLIVSGLMIGITWPCRMFMRSTGGVYYL